MQLNCERRGKATDPPAVPRSSFPNYLTNSEGESKAMNPTRVQLQLSFPNHLTNSDGENKVMDPPKVHTRPSSPHNSQEHKNINKRSIRTKRRPTNLLVIVLVLLWCVTVHGMRGRFRHKRFSNRVSNRKWSLKSFFGWKSKPKETNTDSQIAVGYAKGAVKKFGDSKAFTKQAGFKKLKRQLKEANEKNAKLERNLREVQALNAKLNQDLTGNSKALVKANRPVSEQPEKGRKSIGQIKRTGTSWASDLDCYVVFDWDYGVIEIYEEDWTYDYCLVPTARVLIRENSYSYTRSERNDIRRFGMTIMLKNVRSTKDYVSRRGPVGFTGEEPTIKKISSFISKQSDKVRIMGP